MTLLWGTDYRGKVSSVVQLNSDETIAEALNILNMRVSRGVKLSSSSEAGNYFCLRNSKYEHQEVFSVLFLDAQNRVIAHREMFFGTLRQTAVYPREILCATLELGADAVMLCHNHPSGTLEPSREDIALTRKIKDALDMIDVRLLDHIITAGGQHTSLAEKGII